MQFFVTDANSSFLDENGDQDFGRWVEVTAGSPAEACAKAREEGFDGMLFAAAA